MVEAFSAGPPDRAEKENSLTSHGTFLTTLLQ